MDNFESNWKNKFDSPLSDSKSDWLTPNPDVLDNIMESIQKEDEPKRRYFFWLLFPIILAIGVLSIVIFSNEEKINAAVGSDKAAREQRGIIKTINTDKEIELGTAISDNQDNQNKKSGLSSSLTSEASENTTLSNIIESKQEKAKPKKSEKAFQNIPIDGQPGMISHGELEGKKDNPLNEPALNSGLEIGEFSQNIEIENDILRNSLKIDLIESMHIGAVHSNENHNLTIHDKIFPLIKPVNPSKSKHIFNISTGLLFWQDQLNSSYSEALEPASFFKSNENNYFFNVGYQFSFSEVWSAYSTLGISLINNHSGHNSSIEFDNNHNQQDFDLTLATPYGFVESRANVLNSQEVSNSETPLAIDITSAHKLNIIDFEIGIQRTLFSKKRFGLNIAIGPTLSYIQDIKNDIINLNTNHKDYNLSHSQTLSDQAKMNKTLLGFHLNTRLDYHISNSLNIGVLFGYKHFCTPIFENQEFSTQVRNTRVGINLGYLF